MRLKTCEISIDGASRGNPGPAGVGVVLRTCDPPTEHWFAHYLGETTNNVAEYLALLYALQEAVRLACGELLIRSDSELLVRQMTGLYRIRDGQLRLLHDLAHHLMTSFCSCTLEHIPRSRNVDADRLAGEAVTRRLSHYTHTTSLTTPASAIR